MVVKLEHAGVTVELKPEIENDYPYIDILINGRRMGWVNEKGEFSFSSFAKVKVTL